jgi:hypothetical protein
MTYFDDHEDRLIYGRLRGSDLDDEPDERGPRCRTCGSTEVRWRQQGGTWTLFSLTPGVLHDCDPEDLVKDFDE